MPASHSLWERPNTSGGHQERPRQKPVERHGLKIGFGDVAIQKRAVKNLLQRRHDQRGTGNPHRDEKPRQRRAIAKLDVGIPGFGKTAGGCVKPSFTQMVLGSSIRRRGPPKPQTCRRPRRPPPSLMPSAFRRRTGAFPRSTTRPRAFWRNKTSRPTTRRICPGQTSARGK